MRALMGWLTKEFKGQVVVGLVLFILSACTAPTHPTNQPTDPPFADSLTRPLAASQLDHLHQAAYNYARYHALAPDDLLGLKRLTEVCAALEQAGVEDESCGGAAALREELEARTDDRRIVAELLDVPVEDVELGPNLVENGGFEEWVDGGMKAWVISDMATGDPRNRGVFIGGRDTLNLYEGDAAARVNGLWLEKRPDRESGRYGFWQWDEKEGHLRKIHMAPGAWFVVSLTYRTRALPDGAATMWLSDGAPSKTFVHEMGFPSIDGFWKHDVVLHCNPLDKPLPISPLVRIWRPGQVWFDEIEIKRIEGLSLPSCTSAHVEE